MDWWYVHHVRCKNNDPTTDWSDFQIEIVTTTGVLWVLSHPLFDWGKACFTPVVLHPISYKHTYCKAYGYNQNSFGLYRNEATSSNHIIIKIYSRLSVENDEKAYIVV